MAQRGLELVLRWDNGAAGDGLMCCTTTSVSLSLSLCFLNLSPHHPPSFIVLPQRIRAITGYHFLVLQQRITGITTYFPVKASLGDYDSQETFHK